MPIDIKLLERNAPPLKQTLVNEREKLSQEAELARSLLQAWGMAGVPDGEDAAGRFKFRPIEPRELVDRVMSVTRQFMQQVRLEGWVVDLPSADELTAEDQQRTGF